MAVQPNENRPVVTGDMLQPLMDRSIAVAERLAQVWRPSLTKKDSPPLTNDEIMEIMHFLSELSLYLKRFGQVQFNDPPEKTFAKRNTYSATDHRQDAGATPEEGT